MEKVVILIGLEFIFGPILKDDQLDDGSFTSGSKIVDKDPILNQLDKETNELWCSLYSKDETSPDGLHFATDKEKELAPKLLGLINQIKDRLNQINDGSFEIEDMISNHLESLL